MIEYGLATTGGFSFWSSCGATVSADSTVPSRDAFARLRLRHIQLSRDTLNSHSRGQDRLRTSQPSWELGRVCPSWDRGTAPNASGHFRLGALSHVLVGTPANISEDSGGARTNSGGLGGLWAVLAVLAVLARLGQRWLGQRRFGRSDGGGMGVVSLLPSKQGPWHCQEGGHGSQHACGEGRVGQDHSWCFGRSRRTVGRQRQGPS